MKKSSDDSQSAIQWRKEAREAEPIMQLSLQETHTREGSRCTEAANKRPRSGAPATDAPWSRYHSERNLFSRTAGYGYTENTFGSVRHRFAAQTAYLNRPETGSDPRHRAQVISPYN